MLAAGTEQADDLIEREGELALIENALRPAAEGSGSLVVVEGPAGIGKTRLLREARRRAEGRRLRVLHATGGELETGFAYGVVRQLLDAPLAQMTARERRSALSGAAALAAPLLGFHDATEEDRARREPLDPSFGLLHGLYWLIANLAAERPLLLELDDAQWSDAASLHFLLYLVRRLEGLGILITVATRTGEGGDHQALVARLVSADAARVVRPRALSPVGAADLAASIFGEVVAEEFAAACHRATGGNPYLLRELLVALREEGVRPTVEATAAIAALGPRAVSHSVLLRLGRLPPPSHSLARAVAVLGG